MQPAACETVSDLSAMLIVPIRAPVVLASTRNATEPLPLPDAPAVMLIHAALLVADHVHPAAVLTVTAVPAPPAAPMDCAVESIE